MNSKEVILELSVDKWVKIKISNSEYVYKPKYFHLNVDWKNIEELGKKRIPYVYAKYENDSISYLKASSGIVREVPIFYSSRNGLIIVTDEPENILLKFEVNDIDELSIQEFLCFGYSTSSKTLFKEIASLQAGEVLIYSGSGIEIKEEYLYNTSEIYYASQDELINELRVVSEEIFHDLILSLRGKKAIVPLSGGYDSRFIVSMLKRGGFEDVICYAWGGETESAEKEISKVVASKLGYEWKAVNYTEDLWEKTFGSDWFDDCLRYVSKFTSISGAASLPFLSILNNNHSTHDSVVIPGHTGDFIGGGHIPYAFSTKSKDMEVTKSILEAHLIKDIQQPYHKHEIWNSINRQVIGYSSKTDYPYQTYELWEWRERQSKFITNINRYYDFWGFKWNMPLWNSKFVDFWSTVSLEQKRGLNLYHKFLETTIFEELDINITTGNKKTVTNHIKLLLGKANMLEIAKVIKSKIVPQSIPNHFGFDNAFTCLWNEKNNESSTDFIANFKSDKKIFESISPYSQLANYVLCLLREGYKEQKTGF